MSNLPPVRSISSPQRKHAFICRGLPRRCCWRTGRRAQSRGGTRCFAPYTSIYLPRINRCRIQTNYVPVVYSKTRWQNDHVSATRWPTPYSGFKTSMSIAPATRRLVTHYGRPDMKSNTQVGHCKRDKTDVYIGRGRGGRDMLSTPIGKRGWLGNPHTVDNHGRSGSIERFRKAFEHRLENDPEFRARVQDLAGSRLGCWCQSLDDDGPACHGEVIAEHADRLAEEADE